MANEIFIIGRNRSGTKWLSNLLANNEEVSAVQHEDDGGIIEADVLDTYPQFFDIKKTEHKTAFEILFKNAKFHHNSGLDDEILKQMNFDSFYQFFKSYMDEYAMLNNTKYWLQKASSLRLPVIAKKFPKAKIIIIHRQNVVNNVLSSIALYGNRVNFIHVLKNVLLYQQHIKIEKKFIGKSNIINVSYEDLKNDTENVLKEICNFLSISYNRSMLDVKFKPNTSFKTDISRKNILNNKNISKIRFAFFLTTFLPLWVIDFLSKIYKCFVSKNKIYFRPRTFIYYRK